MAEFMRAEFSPCRALDGETDETDTFVLGPETERVCVIPATRAPFIPKKREAAERWELASKIADLLCADAARARSEAKAFSQPAMTRASGATETPPSERQVSAPLDGC